VSQLLAKSADATIFFQVSYPSFATNSCPRHLVRHLRKYIVCETRSLSSLVSPSSVVLVTQRLVLMHTNRVGVDTEVVIRVF
jgi:hypothetical protein